MLYIPQNTYPTGVVSAEANLDRPGQYTAIVTLEGLSPTIQFPIRVALWAPSVVALVGVFLQVIPRMLELIRALGKSAALDKAA